MSSGTRLFVLKSYQLGVGIVLIALIMLMAVIVPYFWTANNLLEVLRQVSPIAMLTAVCTFVILTVGINLSVGSALGVCAMLAIVTADAGLPRIASIAFAVAGGAVVDAINGVFVARFTLQAFIVILAALTYLR